MEQEDALQAIEVERRRLAKILDDDIVTSLELLQAQASTYRDVLRSNQQAQMSLNVLHSLIQQVLQKVRYVQANLHPTVLETLGLEPALETLSADAKRVRGLTINLTIPRLRERLPQELELILFRVVQSLIDTASTLAHATHFDIQLAQSDNVVSLIYQDNGQWQSAHRRLLHTLNTPLISINGKHQITLQDSGNLSVDVQVTIQNQQVLTPREIEILQSVAEGITNKQIASDLHISARTVNFHLDNIYSKLQVNTRTEAVMLALQHGWIQNPVK